MRKIITTLLFFILCIVSISITASATENIPTKFSAVEQGWVTPVINQGNVACCTASSVVSTVESALLSQGYSNANTLNLSELHFAYCEKNIFPNKLGLNTGDNGSCNSSDKLFSLGYPINQAFCDTMRNVGLTLENDKNSLNKYNTYEDYINSLNANEKLNYINNSEFQVSSFFSSNDMNTCKKHIMKYGAMTVGINQDSIYLRNKTYYYCDVELAINHAVTVVGWDDTISKNNFKTKTGNLPEGDGAWLVKNSYGTKFADNGYMWISYYDKSLTEFYGLTCTYKGSDEYYDNCYQYDSGGKYKTILASKYSNVFTADSDEVLKAISYLSDKENIKIELKIYINCNADNPESGNLVYQRTIAQTSPGYHNIKLEKCIELNKGTRYSIVLASDKLTSFINAECNYNCINGGFTKNPSINSGESFYYRYNSNNSGCWKDMYDIGGKNLAIKAYTNERTNISNSAVTLKTINSGSSTIIKASVTCNGKKLIENTDYKLSYPNGISSNKGTLIITGVNEYTGTLVRSYDNSHCSINSTKILLSATNYEFTGSQIKPTIKVTYGNTVLKLNTDYTVTYKNNISVGTGQVVITGKGKYYGSLTKTFQIVRKPISKASFSNYSTTVYKGTLYKPNIVVKANNKTLVLGKDYKVTYCTNTTIGKKYITITGTGNYCGTKKLYYNVVAKPFTQLCVTVNNTQINSTSIKITWNKLSGATGYYIYKKNANKWIRICDTKSYSYTLTGLKSGSKIDYYIVAYQKKGNSYIYSKKTVCSNTTTLNKVTNLTATKKNNSITLKWNKVSNADGYFVYGYDSKEKKWKNIKCITSNNPIFTIKSNKYTIYAVCAYKDVGKKRIFSKWSNNKYI